MFSESIMTSLHQLSPTSGAIIVAVLVLLFVRWASKKRYRLPPGPTPIPLIGNLLAFRGSDLGAKFNEWKAKYGPIFTMYAGPKRIVVINNIDTMNEAFVKQGSDFSDRPYFYSAHLMTEGSKDIGFGVYGETWKYQRKIAVQALRQYLTGVHLQDRVSEAVQPVIEAMRMEKEAFCPHRYISLSVFNVIHGLCFGTPFELDDPVFLHLLKVFDDAQVNVGNGFLEDFFPPLRLWPSKRFTDTIRDTDVINSYIAQQLKEHKKNLDRDNIGSLTDTIIVAQQEAEKEENPAIAAMFTDTHAAQILNDVFGAGVDTTRMTVEWFVLVMATYPKIQERIVKELDDVIGTDIPGKEHRSKLVYTEAVLLETMRMYYVLPIGVPHQTLKDTTVAGYEIPAKTTVLANSAGIMRDPELWDDPCTFKPERFMDETETKLMTKQKSFAPFSLGQRSCLGESLAKLEMVYIIAGLMKEFKFSLPPGTKADFTSSSNAFGNAPPLFKVVISSRRD